MFWRIACFLALSSAVLVKPPFREGSLHEQMHSMMTEGKDGDAPWKESSMIGNDDISDDDPYMKEAADGLSKALGPRWDKKTLEADANRKTRALLKGISGSSSMRSLSNMLGALR